MSSRVIINIYMTLYLYIIHNIKKIGKHIFNTFIRIIDCTKVSRILCFLV